MDIDALREPSRELIDAAMASEVGYKRLGWLCDRIGGRGFPGARRSTPRFRGQ